MFSSFSGFVDNVVDNVSTLKKSAVDEIESLTTVPEDSSLGRLMQLHEVISESAASMGVTVGKTEAG